MFGYTEAWKQLFNSSHNKMDADKYQIRNCQSSKKERFLFF